MAGYDKDKLFESIQNFMFSFQIKDKDDIIQVQEIDDDNLSIDEEDNSEIDDNNYGVSGIEKYFDKELRGNKISNSLFLSSTVSRSLMLSAVLRLIATKLAIFSNIFACSFE